MDTAQPLYTGLANKAHSFLAYQPDSQYHFQTHNEFEELYGRFIKNNTSNNAGDVTRLWGLILNIKQVIRDRVLGDFAEIGVWRGNAAAVLSHYAYLDRRQVYLFDTFEGVDPVGLSKEESNLNVRFDFSDTSISMVQDVIGPSSQSCVFVRGKFPSSLTQDHKKNTYAVVSLDCDFYDPIKAGLEFFYPLMPRGGLFLIHDYSSGYWAGVAQAVDEFCAKHGQYPILYPDKSGSALIRKV
jgi:hypothetical protein